MERAGNGEGHEPFGLLNDVMFKCVFGDERDLTLLSLLVNGLLGRGKGERVEMTALRTPVVEREHAWDRYSIFDLSAVDRERGLYIVEVQRELHRFFGERLIHYLARLYCQGLKRGEKYREQKRALLLGILDFELFPGTGRVTSRLLVRNEEGDAVSWRFAAVCVELGKVQWKEPGELATSEKKWHHILKFAERYNDLERLPGPLAEEEGLEMVMDKVRRVNRTPVARALMEAREKIRRDNENFIDDAFVEGEAKGEAKGEVRRSREIAASMKARGMDCAVIAEITGISAEEIEAL